MHSTLASILTSLLSPRARLVFITNSLAVTNFVFDNNDACEKGGSVYEAAGGKECLTVSGRMEGFAMTCLVLYAVLCWAIARFSVWELKKCHN